MTPFGINDTNKVPHLFSFVKSLFFPFRSKVLYAMPYLSMGMGSGGESIIDDCGRFYWKQYGIDGFKMQEYI